MGDLNRIRIGISADSLVVSGDEQTDMGGAVGANLQFEVDDVLIDMTVAAELLMPLAGGSGTSNLSFHLALLGEVDPDIWIGGQSGVTFDMEGLEDLDVIPTGEMGALMLANVADNVALSVYAGVATSDFQEVSFKGAAGIRLSWDLYDSSDLPVGAVADPNEPRAEPAKIIGFDLIEPDQTNMFVLDPLTLQIETSGPADVEIYIIDDNGDRVYDLGTHKIDGVEELSFLRGKFSLSRRDRELKGDGYRVVVRVKDGDGLQYGTQPIRIYKTYRNRRP